MIKYQLFNAGEEIAADLFVLKVIGYTSDHKLVAEDRSGMVATYDPNSFRRVQPQ